ncbi:MAG: TIGR04282 family arsenosugar biosynthesis glycosyltransferase [Sulfitobacter sp.]
MRRTLIVMLKEPRAGRVKTRLGRDIGMVAAAWWFRHQLHGLLRRVEDPRWNLVLAVAPDRAGMLSRVWPSHLARIPQGNGDLGDRMGRALRWAPRGPVCVIGGDIPDINSARIAEAFAALGSNDAVFGPADDGGYWLIGLRRTRAIPPQLFSNVRWSTQHALDDSRATLPHHRIVHVATLRDVDTVADLRLR